MKEFGRSGEPCFRELLLVCEFLLSLLDTNAQMDILLGEA
jgi:hypothetical protein